MIVRIIRSKFSILVFLFKVKIDQQTYHGWWPKSDKYSSVMLFQDNVVVLRYEYDSYDHSQYDELCF